MKNDRQTISANEVNKFTYCPHQWYYERLYGTKELRAKYRERNERLGLEDATAAHFARGLAFHSRFAGRRVLRWIVLAGIAAVVVWLWWTQGGF